MGTKSRKIRNTSSPAILKKFLNEKYIHNLDILRVISYKPRMKEINRGLETKLSLESVLQEFWYPIEFSESLGVNSIIPVDLFNKSWVLFRNSSGSPSFIKDSCAHRACPLSLGKVENGIISCAYHGWKFTGDGKCISMPSTILVKNICVENLNCIEDKGLIWVYPGKKKAPYLIPSNFTEPPHGFKIHEELQLHVPVEHGLLIENLLDLAHAPFTHTKTFAKGWPVPELVKFHANKMLGGRRDPYPI